MNNTIELLTKKHQMINTFEIYILPNSIDVEYKMGVCSFNRLYFNDGRSLLNSYSLFINDFIKFANNQKRIVRIIEFLEDSIKNSFLSDSITYFDFTIKDDHILFERNGVQEDWINMGEIISDDYQINFCGSYMFFTDLLSDEQFMYYGD